MGLTLRKCVCVCVCIYFVSCLCRDWFCGLTCERAYMRTVLKYASAYNMREFDGPEVTLCSWHDVKIQLLTDRFFVCPLLRLVPSATALLDEASDEG